MIINNRFYLYSIFYVLGVFLLAACGGGGGSSSDITDSYGISLSYPTANANLGGVSQTSITGKLTRSDGETVVAGDISFVSVNNVFATLDASDPTRWSVQIPVAINKMTNLDITVVYSDGSVDTLDHQLNNTLEFSAISNLTLNENNNRVLVLDFAQKALGTVNLDTGESRIISSADTGVTLEAGAEILFPIAVAIDSDNNRALVIQAASSMILAVDLTTGDRSFFSAAGDFSNPVSIIVDTENQRALVIDNDIKAIIAIHLNTGARNIVSGSLGGGLVLGDGPAFIDPKTIVFIESSFVLVMDTALNGQIVPIGSTDPVNPLFEVNLTTGERRIITDNNTTGSGPDFISPQAIGLDLRNPAAPKALVFNNGNSTLYAVDAVTGDRTVVSSPDPTLSVFAFGLIVDNTRQRVLLPSFSGGLVAIDLNTGTRTAFAKSSTGTGAALMDPEHIIFDSAGNRAFIVDGVSVIAVDMQTGDRTVFSETGTGAGAAFINPKDMVADNDNNRLLVLDEDVLVAVNKDTGNRTDFADIAATGLVLDSANNRVLLVRFGAFLAIDLISGEQMILSDSALGSGPDINPGKIALDSTNNRVLIINSFPGSGFGSDPERGVLAIDLTTGIRTVLLAGSSIGGLSDPRAIAVDSERNRVLVTDGVPDTLIAVDLDNGNRSVFSDASTTGPVFADPEGIAVDSSNHRALLVDASVNALLVMNLATGERAIVSR